MTATQRDPVLLHTRPVSPFSAESGDGALEESGRRGSPGRADPSLVIAHQPFDAHSERVRALRTELLLRRQGPGALCVALLSPCHGEGRSQLVAELAVAFARTGRQTLLVDADLRRPRQHALFGVDNRVGLSDTLQDGAPPLLHAVEGLPTLSLLSAGRTPQNPLELLADDRFAALVDGWRSNYGFVLFDTPPVRDFSDALAVSTIVGQVLTLSRAQHTPYHDARELLKRLAATQARVLGAVINHF
ncbi:CpsD/CapB family tyrosine-protein kinase [Solimonas flava]|uniref:CpsD/CapB family tyrosine-protein kinase n=1 Tax=Solimonas flava TaxID=415849 RepID=UPI000405AA54|nr:CpsD/CapB family tyrosine-protein kinase [Solimonas flava]